MALSGLTLEEQQKAVAIIKELESRGISVKDEVKSKKALRWPVDSKGFFVREDGRSYDPNDKQLPFITSNARFVAFISGRGGGKTAGGAQKALQKIQHGKGGAVLNPDFENFKTSTWPEFKQWIPWGMVVPNQRYRMSPEWSPHQPFTMTFLNGVNVLCKGLKDPDSARGPNNNWLWYDEAGRDKDGLSWQIAVASVRIGKDPQAFITTTPRGKFHWIYDFFEKQDIPEDAKELFEKEGGDRELIEMFTTTIHENMDNLDPGFVASMLAAYPKGYLRDQEIFGKFVTEGGALGDPKWFDGRILPEPSEDVAKKVRYWDLAATEKKIAGKNKNDPDETVGTLLDWDGEDKFCIEHQHCGFWVWKDIKKQIVTVAEIDGPYIPIYVELEPGAGGKNQVAEIQEYVETELGSQWKVEGHKPEGDKVMRANVWFAEAALGKFYMVIGAWNDGFLDQLGEFPEVKHDDRIDSVSGARAVIAPIKRWKHVPFLHV